MGIEKLNKNKKIFWALFACVILFAGMLFARMMGFLVTSAATEQMFEQNVALNNQDTKEYTLEDDSQRIAQELIENNMFMPTEQRDCPIKDVNGIMGNEVLIWGQWYKVGDTVADAIILEVGTSYAKVKWRDSIRTLELSSEIPAVARQPSRGGRGTAPQVNQIARTQRTSVTPQINSGQQDSLAWMGVQLTAEQRQKVETIWSSMPEQFRSVMQQQWTNMPAAERTRSLQELDRMTTEQLNSQMSQMQIMMEQGSIRVP